MSNGFTSRMRRLLWADRSGNVSMIFAFLAIPVLGCVGLAVDVGRQAQMQTRMQNALDSAVLAGANSSMSSVPGANGSEGPDMTALVQQSLSAALADTGAKPFVTVDLDPAAGAITASAETIVDNMFMGLLGREQTKVRASATAVAGTGGPMEVAIAFDTTHSMAGTKLAAAQQAASDLTDLLYRLPGSTAPNPNMKVGLVPFTTYVNVGMSNRGASWLTGDADYLVDTENCWDTWPQLSTPVHHSGNQTCFADGSPYDCSYSYDDYNDYSKSPTHTCTPVTDQYVWRGCVASQNDPDDAGVAANAANPVPARVIGTWQWSDCPAEISHLSNDPDTIKTAISNLVEGGETYIAPGLLWGWRVLSDDPDGPFHNGGPIASTKKRLILLTDGSNTHSANYVSGLGNGNASANGNANANANATANANSNVSGNSNSGNGNSNGNGNSGNGNGNSGNGNNDDDDGNGNRYNRSASSNNGNGNGNGGNLTSPIFIGDHEASNVSDANAKTLEVCTNIKAAGIEIYAIAFEVTDASAQTLLSQCASGPPYYYNAMTTADLAQAFQKIGRELVAMRLTK